MPILLSLLAAPAHAQAVGAEIPEINAQNFRPSIDAMGTLWADDAEVQKQRFSTRALFHYTLNPLVYEFEDDDERVKLVSDVLQADVTAAVRVSRVRLGLDLPIYLLQAGEGGQGFGLGDVGIDGKLGILDHDDAPLGLAVSARADFPTATVANALGSPNTGWEAAAIVDREIGDRLLLALNVGYRGGAKTELENISLDDFLTMRLAGSYGLGDDAGVALEFAGAKSLATAADPGASFPLEWLASGYGYVTDSVAVRGGVGTGITSGIGSPDLRVLVGVGFEPRDREEEGPADPDADGIVGDADACPTEAEDKDGFEDANGCPDADNDQDGVTDGSDKCPDAAEDKDGVRDVDGCAEPETLVTVRLLNADDGAPLAVGRATVKGSDGERAGTAGQKFELAPGHYEVAGTATNFEGSTAAFDVAENTPLAVDVKLKPVKEAKIVVTRERIELREKVFFDLDKDTIQARSNPLLEQVAKVMNEYPEIKRLRIEGHTDSRGDDAYNLDLSQRRADAVKAWLVAKGVAADRLVAKGLGETVPLDTAENDAAWEKNRRVEVFIEAWEDPKAPAK